MTETNIVEQEGKSFLVVPGGEFIRILTPGEFYKETSEVKDYRQYYAAKEINKKCYFIHKRSIEDWELKFPDWQSKTVNKKKGNYLDKNFSFLDYYDKLVEDHKKGEK